MSKRSFRRKKSDKPKKSKSEALKRKLASMRRSMRNYGVRTRDNILYNKFKYPVYVYGSRS